MDPQTGRRVTRALTGFITVVVLAFLYGCGAGLSENVKQKANALPGSIKTAASFVDGQRENYEKIRRTNEFDPIKRFALKEDWNGQFDAAHNEISKAQQVYSKEIVPLVKKNKPESAPQILKLIHRVNKITGQAKAASRLPMERFAEINNTIANIDRLKVSSEQDAKQIEQMIKQIKEDSFDKAVSDFPDNTAAINARFSGFMEIQQQTQTDLDQVKSQFDLHSNNQPADYAVFTDSVKSIASLREKTKTLSAEKKEEIGQLYQSYTKILKDMKAAYYVTVKRESWDENSDFYNPAFSSFTREVDLETYEAVTADNLDTIAELKPGYGRPSMRSKIGNTWNELNIHPMDNWPSRYHNAASFWVESSQEKYFHQYILENDGQTEETGWETVSADFYDNNLEFLGMAILAKPYGTFEQDRLTQAAPPGMAYVGNPEYGEWKDDENGDRFWSWYGKWAFFSHLFFFPPYYYGYHSWYGWHNNYRYKKPYFGKTKKRVPEIRHLWCFCKKITHIHENELCKKRWIQDPGRFSKRCRVRSPWRWPQHQRKIIDIKEERMNAAALFTGLGQALIYVIAGIAFIWFAKQIDDWRTKDFDDDAHIDDGNTAVGFRRAGLYLGIAIALSGALSGESKGFWLDLIQLIIDGLIISGLMFSTRFINDYIMLGHINNDAECIKSFELSDGTKKIGNTAVGIVEAGMYLATGFIVHGSISGTSGSFFLGVISSILFFILGQGLLLILGLFYEVITPFNVRNEIKKNNPAAAIGLAGSIIALGIILMASISGPFTGWKSDLFSFGIYAIFGIAMLILSRFVIDRLLLPTTKIAIEVAEDKNVAALLVVESAVIAVAIIIAFSM